MGEKSLLVEALIAAQREFSPAIKLKTNPHFRSKYVDLAGALDATQEALWKHGLMVIQKVWTDASGPVLITALEHVSGECRESRYPIIPAKDKDPQALGACITYARRFSLMAILGIAPEDDDGETAMGRAIPESRRKQPEAPVPSPESPKKTEPPKDAGTVDGEELKINELALKTLGWAKPHAVAWLRKYFGVDSTSKMTSEQKHDAVQLLETHVQSEEGYRALLRAYQGAGRCLKPEEK